METKTTEPKKVNYLNNKDMLRELKLSHEKGQMTDELCRMFMKLTERYAKKGCFASYTYNDEMQATAMVNLVRAWRKFNLDKYDNPFAFFTQCIKNSFRQVLKVEKKEAKGRNAMMIRQGLDPSFNFTDEEYEDIVGYNHTKKNDDNPDVVLDVDLEKALNEEFGEDVQFAELADVVPSVEPDEVVEE